MRFVGVFADLCLSALWLSPVIPGKVHRITTRAVVSVDLFLSELPGISREVHHINILPRFVLTLNQRLLIQLEI